MEGGKKMRNINRDHSIYQSITKHLDSASRHIDATSEQLKRIMEGCEVINRNIEKTQIQIDKTQIQIDKNSEALERMKQENEKTFKRMDDETAALKQYLREQDRERKIEQARIDKRMAQLDGLFSDHWSKLIEALATPACLNLFKKYDIGITQVYPGARKGKYPLGEMEVDMILCNTTVAVVVEVKTTCCKEDVDHFLKQMKHFKEAFHPFANYTIYTAVAAIKFNQSSDHIALSKGMFVIHCSGENTFSLTAPKEIKKY